NDTIANARKKLKEKHADLIVANDVTAEGAGFDTDTNIITFIKHDAEPESLPILTKTGAADRILDEAISLKTSNQLI
ncbi:MAG TPA: phosphopantothenoylcysteine decarboxylase, partial [Blastocatellia bacterium]|nr:phosphopantothenoylcysteine decarboxylase [Blastocatellia bacterium]